MAGTTDDDFYGDLDRIETTEDEVAYVLQAMERSIPGIRRHRVIHTIQGVRPTLWGFGQTEDELSRDYEVVDHARDGAPGLFTIAGGKLAAYRLMAEDAADRLCAALGVREPCRTATTPLPGGDGTLDVLAHGARFRTPRRRRGAARLPPRHADAARARGSRRGAGRDATPPRVDLRLRAGARRRAASRRATRGRAPAHRLQRCACGSASAPARARAARRRRGRVLADALDWTRRAQARGAARLRRRALARGRAGARGRHLAAMEIHRFAFLAARGFAS